MLDKRYQVFVSSTFRDLGDHRDRITRALMEVNAFPVGMEIFPSSDFTAWELIQRSIGQSDYYLVIVGGRYGSEGTDGLSFTEKEFDYAVSLGIPVIGFLHASPQSLPRELTEVDPVRQAKLDAFVQKVRSRHCKFWSDPGDLITKVLSSYHQLLISHPALGWIRSPTTDYQTEHYRWKIIHTLWTQQVILSPTFDKRWNFTIFPNSSEFVAFRAACTPLFSEGLIEYAANSKGHVCLTWHGWHFCLANHQLFPPQEWWEGSKMDPDHYAKAMMNYSGSGSGSASSESLHD